MAARRLDAVLKPLIIGQAPGPATDPGLPLSGRSGARLASLCGLDLDEFLASFDRINLLPAFPGKAGSKGRDYPVEAGTRLRVFVERHSYSPEPPETAVIGV